jgi:hypothetical protein
MSRAAARSPGLRALDPAFVKPIANMYVLPAFAGLERFESSFGSAYLRALRRPHLDAARLEALAAERRATNALTPLAEAGSG